MLCKETVSEETMEMVHLLMKDDMLKSFYLVGGTSLALRFGHRKSIDIDLFTTEKFDRLMLENHLREKLDPDWVMQKSHGMAITKGRENIDLWYYPAPIINEPEVIDGVRMLSVEDVACMKVNSIAYGGDCPKDYIDLYYVLEKKSMSDIINAYSRKYSDLPANEHVKCLSSVEPVKDKHLESFDKSLNWEKIEKRLKQAILFPGDKFKAKQGRSKGKRI